MLDSDLSPAAPQGGMEPPQIKPVWCPRAGGSPPENCNHPLSLSSQTFVPSDSLVDGQVGLLGTVHPLFTLDFFITLKNEEEGVVIHNRWSPKKKSK